MQYAYIWDFDGRIVIGSSDEPSAALRREEAHRGERATRVFTIQLTYGMESALKRIRWHLTFDQAKELLTKSIVLGE